MKTRIWYCIFLICIFGLIWMHLSAWADETLNEPVVTRWMTSDGTAKPLHEPLRIYRPFISQKVNSTEIRSPTPPGFQSDRICIVIHNDVYASITTAISQYIEDLESEGFNTVTYIFTSGSPEALRAQLISLYQENESLVGAVLIGNIPYIIYEMIQNWGGGDQYEDFPCDIFYMDMDGTWSDTLSNGSVQPGNGKYDTRGGDLSLEIWVSRLRTDNLLSIGSENDLLNIYFDKNHRYRKGRLKPTSRALIYNDDDWDDEAIGDELNLGMIYDLTLITKVTDAEITTAPDYKANHLTVTYEFICIRSHGSSTRHGFYRNNKSTFEYVFQTDYTTLDPEAVFYSLFVCSGADYTASNNLAGTITFNPDDSGLLSIGSTKAGGILWANEFYTALGNNAVFGESFRLWFNDVQTNRSSYAPRWWYGMVLIGDGALTVGYDIINDDITKPIVAPIIHLLLGN